MNLGINLNYYQSSFGEYTGRTFFGDANLSFKFSAPYAGIPKKLISLEKIESEKQKAVNSIREIFNSRRTAVIKSRIFNSTETEARVSALQTEFNDSSNRIENIYARRRDDLVTVFDKRSIIYRINSSPLMMLKPVNITNILSNAMSEMQELAGIASNTVNVNHQSIREFLCSEYIYNDVQISNIREKIQVSADETTRQKINDYCLTFDRYISEIYTIQNSEILLFFEETRSKELLNSAAEEYKTGKESLRDLAKKKYQDTAFEKLLRNFNRLPAEGEIKPGTALKLPSRDTLEKFSAAENRISNAALMLSQIRSADAKQSLHTVLEGETWSSIAQKYYSDADKAGLLLARNNLDKKQKVSEGMIIIIPDLSKEKALRDKQQTLLNEISQHEKQFGKITAAPLLKFYIDSLIKKYSKKTEIFGFYDKINEQSMEMYRNLDRMLIKENEKFSLTMNDINKKLKKLQLKKELESIDTRNDRKYQELFRDYKKKESIIFKELLTAIYKAKTRVSKQLKNEENSKFRYQMENVASVFDKKTEAWAETCLAKKTEASGDKALLLAAETENKKQQAQINLEFAFAKDNTLMRYEEKNSDYAWQDYLTHMVYVSTEEKRKTMAVGMYLKNIGKSFTYETEKDPLPVSLGADYNYEFVKTENFNSIFYLHYGYSSLENHSFGGGIMYRFIDMIELRHGLSYENGELVFGSAAALMFNLALMNCRIDAGIKTEKNFGYLFNIGLSVLF
ncbi:MAG TPA: hypothetical protein DC049_03970 [Spirochaetia bacterium]|nr:hypothetical protein [Spirochaetia bacterium]